MVFSEKLIFLMNLVSVNNVELARSLHIDPSQISRLRRGVRGMPQKSDLIAGMAAYFASRCESVYQYSAISEMLGADVTAGRRDLTERLGEWLMGGELAERLESPSAKGMEQVGVVAPAAEPVVNAAEHSDKMLIYYGNEGKRRAAREVIGRALRQQTPCTVMISSDENTQWLTEDAAFLEQAKRDLLTLAQGGSQIRRIIPPNLNLNEVYDSFSLWLPLYMAGNVKPYYLRRMRDGIYQRTLLVVPGVAALVSTSIGRQGISGVTYVASAPAIVDSYAREFTTYSAMCSPALARYDPAADFERLSERITTYYKSSAASIRKSDGLSFISIPPRQKQSLLGGSTSALMRLMCAHAADELFPSEQIFFARPVIDIMRLALPMEVRGGEIRYCFDEEMTYTAKEYREHLQYVVALLERYAQYNVVLDGRHPLDCMVYAKRGVGALLFMTKPPYTVIDVTAPGTFLGLWEYLNHIAATGVANLANKRSVIAQLRERIAQLSEP